MLELELKLSVDGPLDVDGLSNHGLEAEDRGVRTLAATYHDTEDLRLARWGATLRYRTGEAESGKWTLKLPGADGDPTARLELDFPGGPRKVPADARLLVVALARSARLEPVAKLRTRRRSWLLTRDDEEVAELVDDEVSVLDGRSVSARFREVEVEARSATSRQLEEIAGILRHGGAAPGEQIPKAVRALGPRAQLPPDVPAPDDVGPNDPAAAAVRASLADAARRIVRHHPAVVLGGVEGVHQMRVGARRLRSDLRTFSSLVDEEWAAAASAELAWLGGVLGEVRDLDVLGARLKRHAAGMDDLAPLFDRLKAERDAKRDELLVVLASERYVSLLDDIVARAADPPVTAAAEVRCRKALPPMVAAAWSSLGKAGRLLDDADPEEDWHRVRIKAKRARYAAEATGRCLGPVAKEAREFASLCASVQDVLGEHQDAVVARDVVVAVSGDVDAGPRFHFHAGRLAEIEDRAARDARAAFSRAWELLDRKKRRKWFS